MTSKTDDRAVEKKSDRLKGRHIGFCVCGGIGAVEVVKIIRELRRHAARVTAFFTPTASRFATELSVAWATGSSVVSDWGPDASHLESLDAVVVAPATLNTMRKVALGISDNVVTVLIAAQIGAGVPVLMFPTMHAHLRNHPLYGESLKVLGEWGVSVFEIREEEHRLKMPSPEQVFEHVVSVLG